MALPTKAQALMAEFIAMTLFVFIGCGAAVASQIQSTRTADDTNQNAFDTLGVALAFGIGISVLAYSIAPISGGHINPAVTLAFVILKQMSIVDGLMYMVVQFIAGILGALILWGCTASYGANGATPAGTSVTPYGLGANAVTNIGDGSGLLVEAMGTFILVWTVMMTAVHKKSIAGNIAPIAIGWSVFLAHIVLIPLTGCGINPARSAGPHIVNAIAGAATPRGVWTFYVGPFLGSAVAALSASTLMGCLEDSDEEEAKANELDKDDSKGDIDA